MKLKKYIVFVLTILFVFLLASLINAQTNTGAPDTLKNTTADTLQTSESLVSLEGDIILEEIQIEAVIEKPRVSFFPKRIDPQFEELEFVDRSFERELKNIPDGLLINDDRLFKPQKIENLRKKIIKNKEKKDQNH